MDLNQATQMINWLEEERRKDKTALSALQERAQGLASEVAEQSKRVQELQAALATTQLNLNKVAQFDRLFEQYKADLVAEMDRREDAHQKAMRESERLRKIEADGTSRSIAEIRKELPRFKPLEDELPMRRAEERRLGEILTRVSQRVDDLSVRTEERVQTVTYLEEGRRQDNKRIAQLEEIDNNFSKRLDALIGKTALLEENLQRMPPRIEEVIRRTQEQDKVFEELRLNDFRRTQEIKVFTEEVNKAIAPIPDHIAGYQRTQEVAMAVHRSLEEIKGFQTHIEGRQAEVAEMQRIAEDRQKKQVEEWQTDYEKRWKRQTLTWFEQWQEHDRVHESWEVRLEQVEQELPVYARQFKVVWDGLEEISKVSLSAARQVAEAQQAVLEKGRPVKIAVGGGDRTAKKS
jgi:DNA repair exonuclease SbcCD ATPase subunit